MKYSKPGLLNLGYDFASLVCELGSGGQPATGTCMDGVGNVGRCQSGNANTYGVCSGGNEVSSKSGSGAYCGAGGTPQSPEICGTGANAGSCISGGNAA